MIKHSMNTLMIKTTLFLTVAGFAFTFSPSPVQAGFDWTPPQSAKPAPKASNVAATLDSLDSVVPVPPPVQTQAPTSVAPISRAQPMQPNGQYMETQPAGGSKYINFMKKDAGSAPAPSQPPVMAPTPAVYHNPGPAVAAAPIDRFYEDAQGFGESLPLAMALSQVVPPDYLYSFAEGVDPGIRVSWEGGRPWNDVISDMMRPHGYEPHIVDKTVIIRIASPSHIANYVPYEGDGSATPASYNGQMPIQNTSKAQALDPYRVSSWEATAGSSLKQVLQDWSGRASVQLYWKSVYDYPLNSAFKVQGTYPQAVEALLSAYTTSTPSPVGTLHPNLPYGPSVLIVE